MTLKSPGEFTDVSGFRIVVDIVNRLVEFVNYCGGEGEGEGETRVDAWRHVERSASLPACWRERAQMI
jgi:hypothetical protein